MTKAERWTILVVVSTALLMIVADMTILYTVMPTITRELGASVEERLWILNAYPLVMAGLLLGSGTLGDRLGHRRMFVIGLAIFGIASTAAAFSPSPAALITSRVLLAVGAAAMMPATLSLIRVTFEDERERAVAIGVWAAVAAGGAAAGPLLGGVLLEHFSWGSVFLVNVPLVILALAGARLIARDAPDRTRVWDLRGSVEVLVILASGIYAIKELGLPDGNWLRVTLAASVCGAVAVLFQRRQARRTDKLVDFHLFANPLFSAGAIGLVFASTTLVGFQLVLVQRLQLVLGLSPLEAGVAILAIPLAGLVAGPLAGYALGRAAPHLVLACTLAVCATGLAWLLLTFGSSQSGAIPGYVLFGAGIGAAMTAGSTIIMSSAPRERAGMAAAIEEVSFELGGVVGIALLSTALASLYAATLPPLGSEVPALARASLDDTLAAAASLDPAAAATMTAMARTAFDAAFFWIVTSALALMGAAAIITYALGQRGASSSRMDHKAQTQGNHP